MCGIVGYAGTRPALGVLLDGLGTLEYRGYDSAGVALVEQGGLWISRNAGKVADLTDAVGDNPSTALVGVGHTRWATCGAPVERNAHPHRDCSGEIAVVHNGIIENHVDLRSKLEEQGHVFTSDTDSECLAHLVEHHSGSQIDFAGAVRQALKEIDGSLAVVFCSSKHPEMLVGARINAPLVVGIGNGENFLASDYTALVASTRKAIPLDDGEVAEVTSDSVKITDLDGNPLQKESIEVTWDHEAAEKGGYEDFMLKEIHEQPDAVRDTLRGRSNSSGLLALDELRFSDGEIRSVDKVFVVACGSSYHGGLVAKHAIEHWNRLPVEIEIASEFRYRDPVLSSNTLVIAISQSGETADTVAAVRYAKEQNAKVIAISNVVGSSITREAGAVLYTHAGPEVGVAATKTLTTQMSALWLIALWLAQTRGALYPAETAGLLRKMWKVPEQMEHVLNTDSAVEEVAKEFQNARTFLFIGRGVGVPVALEGALKLKEISYLHAEGFPAGELKHGPIALLEDGVPVVAIATDSHVQSKVLANIEEAKARGARIVAVANPGDKNVLGLADFVLSVPPTDELLSPVIDVLPLQLLAYHVAKLRGCDPDRPRNLAKSVTVE